MKPINRIVEQLQTENEALRYTNRLLNQKLSRRDIRIQRLYKRLREEMTKR